MNVIVRGEGKGIEWLGGGAGVDENPDGKTEGIPDEKGRSGNHTQLSKRKRNLKRWGFERYRGHWRVKPDHRNTGAKLSQGGTHLTTLRITRGVKMRQTIRRLEKLRQTIIRKSLGKKFWAGCLLTGDSAAADTPENREEVLESKWHVA